MDYFIDPRLKINNGKKGLGVYTNSFIKAETIIENSPFSSCWAEKWINTPENLRKIVFSYPQNVDNYVIGLGYTAIYNHSDNNNAIWLTDTNAIVIKTIKDIQENEEICIHYGDAYWSGGWPKY